MPMFSFTRLFIKKAVLHPSDGARFFVASVEQCTIFSLLKLQATSIDFLFLTHMKTK